ncbi:MAG: alpha/beta hydrolase [Smithellaceae bacterium]|nr:alpha/beta hydrolase [Syntrophaceae bacterium]MDD4242235.1 alpha/beta hydrolase [Smithellaceae bacterium]NLX52997.1 alpha/beta hydrolase [Deltaproteobacteria bacterium]
MRKRISKPRKIALALLLALLLAGAAGCRYMSIPAKDDVLAGQTKAKSGEATNAYNSAVIKGRFAGEGINRHSTLVLAWRPGDADYTEYAVAAGSGPFMLYLPQGRYRLFAITDYNRNGVFEAAEVSGRYGAPGGPEEISVREGELVSGVVIALSRSGGHSDALPLEWRPKKKQPVLRQLTHNGQTLKVYHEYFSPENAQTGYWNPSSFMKVFGAHIYLAEDYSPRKIPILFVHGTEGSPHNWMFFCMRLDRSRYQPWFFYYPSGIRLGLAASLLDEELRELHNRYGFTKMVVVAHSVGGLTTRSFLTRYASDKEHAFIRLFFTLATPWSGFSVADASQILTHKSIPAWIDLGTQSAFIANTLADELPKNVRHYIFYGKDDSLCGDKALDDRAVSCAVQLYSFPCDHTSILSDRRVFAQFGKILEKELW